MMEKNKHGARKENSWFKIAMSQILWFAPSYEACSPFIRNLLMIPIHVSYT